MSENHRKDLIILVADYDIQNVIVELLSRPTHLQIRKPSFDVERHYGRDSGCRSRSPEQLRPFLKKYRYALVIFDRHGCGSTDTREKIQEVVERGLAKNGWSRCSKAIVIDPEIEAWVWNHSPRVCQILGWDKNYETLKNFLRKEGLWPRTQPKPPKPKEAMDTILRATKERKSSNIFKELANSVNLKHCQDPAFNELLQTLREWFPPQPRTVRHGIKR